ETLKGQPPGDYKLQILTLDLVNDAGGAFTTVEEMLPAIAAVTAGVDRWLDEAAPAFSTLFAMLRYVIDQTPSSVAASATGCSEKSRRWCCPGRRSRKRRRASRCPRRQFAT
uniref:hypothetical protein n=1 Tax=Qipengyuania sp. TaxID=2004515 RepID=UPI0035C7CCA2